MPTATTAATRNHDEILRVLADAEQFAASCPHPQEVAKKLESIASLSQDAWALAGSGAITVPQAQEVDNRCRALRGGRAPRTTLADRMANAAKLLGSVQWDGVPRIGDSQVVATITGNPVGGPEAPMLLTSYMVGACLRAATPGHLGCAPLYVVGVAKEAVAWVKALCTPFGEPYMTTARDVRPHRATVPVVIFEGQGTDRNYVTTRSDVVEATDGANPTPATTVPRAWAPAVCSRRGYEGVPSLLVTAKADLPMLRGLAAQLWAEAQHQANQAGKPQAQYTTAGVQ